MNGKFFKKTTAQASAVALVFLPRLKKVNGMRTVWLSVVATFLVFPGARSWSQNVPYQPPIAQASAEGEQAIATFRAPPGTRIELVAAEPLLANPVAFSIDEQGRFYVCETFRQQRGVEDNRGHMYWLQDDLQAEDVEDRRAYILKHHAGKIEHYTSERERIRLLTDTTGDGRLDRASIFAEGFNDIVDGTGAGVLALDGDVFFTCIPKLWKFRDTTGDDVADVARVLHNGFGVRFAFRGHDLHGLTLGPDGRIYFSLGDRGYNVQTAEGQILHRADTGAVFRCERDGANLEVFAYGLRNPQELAFDDAGNLFTGDNNSDSGDRARWVHVCEGGDSGWRMNFQYLPDRGPWNRERIWHPYRADEQTTQIQPAYIIPPVAFLADGPSGLVAYYGVGLPERYRGHFFLADFRGQAANSGIRSFANQPRGAGFEVVDSHEYLWSTLATDVEFGYDGRMYYTDWVSGWEGLGKGRIYRCLPEQESLRTAGDEVAALFRQGFREASVAELTGWLKHADRRVRQRTQLELVRRHEGDLLVKLALGGDDPLTRQHALWGVWELGRQPDSARWLAPLLPLLADTDAELVAQACQVLGDCRHRPAEQEFTRLLEHPAPRVRYFAALGLGKLESTAAIAPLFRLLADNKEDDPILRHAAVMGLTGAGRTLLRQTGDLAELQAGGGHTSPSVRMGVLLALRRLRHPGVAAFLTDGEPRLVLEAARAIHDEPMLEAYPALAAVPVAAGTSAELARRVLHANFTLGHSEHAERIARIAALPTAEERVRLEALEELAMWEAPTPFDRVTNRYRELAPRPADYLEAILRRYLGALLNGTEAIQKQAVALAAQRGVRDVVPILRDVLADESRDVDFRVAALLALDRIDTEPARERARQLLTAPHPELRIAARDILVVREPEQAAKLLAEAMQHGTPFEQQAALRQLATLPASSALALLKDWLERLLAGNVPEEIHLDLLLAAEQHKESRLQLLVAEYNRRRDVNDALSQFRECLVGGDARRGEELFAGSAVASCRRCHEVNGQGGGVGPDLSEIAKLNDRRFLLESLLLPDAKIAKGFETVLIVTTSGKIISGILREETDDYLLLIEPLGGVVKIPRDDIDDRAVGKSGMPGDFARQLSKSEIRDLVEYLATLKQKKVPAAHGVEKE